MTQSGYSRISFQSVFVQSDQRLRHDEMLETFAAVGEPTDPVRFVREHRIADSICFDAKRSPDVLAAQMGILRE